MEGIQGIMEKLETRSGMQNPYAGMSWVDIKKLNCELYNNSQGFQGEIDGYDCKKCQNRGDFAEMKYINNDWYEVHPLCSCMEIRKTILRLMKSGLKNIIKDYTFDKYEASEPWQNQIKNKAVEYANSPDGWFFIGGQSGAGKTHICTAIAGHFLNNEKQVSYMLWRDEITRLKACITDAEKYADLINGFKKIDVLYIDDLFKNGKGADGKVSPPTRSDIDIAFEILNYRVNNKELITIISSERTIYDLLAIDEALGGRISEMSFNRGYGFNINSDKKKNYRTKYITNL